MKSTDMSEAPEAIRSKIKDAKTLQELEVIINDVLKTGSPELLMSYCQRRVEVDNTDGASIRNAVAESKSQSLRSTVFSVFYLGHVQLTGFAPDIDHVAFLQETLVDIENKFGNSDVKFFIDLGYINDKGEMEYKSDEDTTMFSVYAAF